MLSTNMYDFFGNTGKYSYIILYYLILSYLILSYLILSYLILSYLILSVLICIKIPINLFIYMALGLYDFDAGP